LRPVAAYLAKGVDQEKFGAESRIRSLQRFPKPKAIDAKTLARSRAESRPLGNLVTNIPR